jgi:hypothetical protein
MRTNFTEKISYPFQIIGKKLYIHFNETEEIREEQTSYTYDTVVVKTNTPREEMIEAIIASKYSIGAEFAVINNKEEKPQEYEDYQNFRNFAKSLANHYFNFYK